MENHFNDYCFIWLGATIREVARPDVKLLHEKSNGLFVMSFPTDPQREMCFLCILPLLIHGWTKMSIRSLKCHSSPSPLRRGGERRVPYGLGGGDLWHFRLFHTPLSSAEAPAGYPFKNSNNWKNKKRAGAQRALAQHKEASVEERVHNQFFWQCRLFRRIQNILGSSHFHSLFIYFQTLNPSGPNNSGVLYSFTLIRCVSVDCTCFGHFL